MSTEDLAIVEPGDRPLRSEIQHRTEDLIRLWATVSDEERCAWAGEMPVRPPVGYVRHPTSIEPDPERAPAVTELFRQVASNSSLAEALEALRQGVLTVPVGNEGVSRTMRPAQLKRMLGNPFYTGVVTFRGRSYLGNHQSLVDRATFVAVQRVLLEHRVVSEESEVDGVDVVILCSACGQPLATRQARDFDHRIVDYLCCLGRHAIGIDCPAPAVEAPAVRRSIAEVLNSIRIDAKQLDQLLEVVGAELPSGDELDGSLAESITHIAHLLDQVAELYPITNGAQQRRFLRTVFHEVRVDIDGVVSATTTPLINAVIALSRSVTPPDDPPAPNRESPPPSTGGSPSPNGDGEPIDLAASDDDVAVTSEAKRLPTWVRSHTVATTSLVLVVWWLFARRISETDFDDLGVIRALPLIALIAPVIAIGLLALAVAEGARDRVKLFHVVVITTMLYGIGPLVGNNLQARIVFRHEGIADAIFRTGSVDPGIDAYFNWPGFFSFLALARHMTGISDFGRLALWAPVLFNVLYVLATVIIARTIGLHERVVWGAAVVMLLGNWVGQDYLSPQASAFLVYLIVIAALLIRLEGDSSVTRRERVTIIGLVIVVFAAIVPSHQLTPIVTVMTVAALVLVRGTRARGLPIVMGAILLSWLVYMSATYLQGNLQKMLDLVGDLGAAGSSNVTERLGGSAGHRQVVRLRLLYTGVIGLAAFIGWLLSIKRRQFHWSLTVGVATPAMMMILQPYGGEMILRVFFFALPFLAMYVASMMLGGDIARWRRTRLVAILLGLAIAVPMFFTTRYGNSRLDIFTEDEERSIEALYEEAEPGSLMVAMVDNLPWKHRQYEVHDYETIDRQLVATIDPQVISAATVALLYSDRTRPAYLILSNSQQTYIELLGGLPTDSIAETEALVGTDPGLVKIVDRPSIQIYRLPAQEQR